MPRSVLVVLFLSTAFGQYTIKEMPVPVSGTSRLVVAPDNKIWSIDQTGSLLVTGQQDISFKAIGMVNPNSFYLKGSTPGSGTGPWMLTSSLFPQSGGRSLFGEFSVEWTNQKSLYKNVTIEASVNPPNTKTLCSNYTLKGIDNDFAAPVSIFGPYPSKNGVYRMLVTGSDTLTALFTLNTSNCSIDLVVKTSVWLLQAWPIGNNLYLVERILNPNMVSQVTEIGTVDVSGKFTSLVKSDRSDRCDLVMDWSRESALVSCKNTKGGRVVLIRDGIVREVHSGSDVSQSVRAIALNGDYAVFGGSSSNSYQVDTLFLANLRTGVVSTLVSAGDKVLPSIASMTSFKPEAVGVSSDGVVYFGGTGTSAAKWFMVTPQVLVPPQLDPLLSNVLPTSLVTVRGKHFTQGIVLLLQNSLVQTTFVGTDTLTFTAPVNPGTYSVQARVVLAGQEVFSNVIPLTVVAPVNPVFQSASVVDAASGRNFCSPGGICSVYGIRLATVTAIANSVPLPTTIAGTQVSVNGISASLFFVSPEQINLQMPRETPTGQAIMVVRSESLFSLPVAITVVSAGPGLFQAHGLAIAQDALTGALTGRTESPFYAGQTVVLYATGLGRTDCEVGAGSPTPLHLCTAVQTVSVSFGGEQAQVLWAGLSPGWIGLYQVNMVVPAVSPAGDAPRAIGIALEVGGQEDTSSKGMFGQRGQQ